MAIKSWILQRITAVLIIPVIIYFVSYFMNINTFSYDDIKNDITSVPGILIIFISSFTIYLHSALGLEVIIEDYIHHAELQRILVHISNIFHLILLLFTVSMLFIISGTA
ncbi:MAG: succinate dehydrogenase, hydrophobic membrane anchor protein [Pseudomonadota bacterium]|nr:succinate dehydrogenase, hydrophobic membrane anchor protein [Pseudomonadota bacterium]MEC8996463.1 succinate dehydrogenase, hydrophobic membrane anchor protein [Pseudomonadota bacterium]MED5430056.1 succinate dehydrogenase, hydrophobic membrane anchor protein [Pseudomonadota bacterium]